MKFLKLLLPLIIFGFVFTNCKNDKRYDSQKTELKSLDDDIQISDSIAKKSRSRSKTSSNGSSTVIDSDNNKNCNPFNTIYYKPSQRHITIGLAVSKVNHVDLMISNGSSAGGTETSNPDPEESKPEDSKYKKYKLTDSKNLFTTSKNKIHLEIPVSNPKLWIKNVVNISNYDGNSKINAILILLAPSDEIYEETSDNPTLLIRTDLDISKISGLRKDLLELHKKLKVYIYYDDDITKCTIDYYKNCVQYSGYTSIHCPLDLPPGTIGAPREQGGDVIGGGG